MRLIGLAGKAGTGKDTVAAYLKEQYGYDRYGLADPIKSMLRQILVLFDNPALKELPHPLFGKSPRYMAQTLGTEWGRNLIHPDLWLICAGQAFEWLQKQPGFVGIVISDVRFENEAAWVRAQGGQIWHVLRPSAAPVEAHVSEAGVGYVEGDEVINNIGSIEDLQQKIEWRIGTAL